MYFTKTELSIWGISGVVITLSFFLFGGESLMTLVASLIGVTSLTLNAKGNPIGQFLTILFSMLYGFISYQSAYYGEMLTYLGMTAPMAAISMVTWMRNRVDGKKLEVKIRRLQGKEIVHMLLLTAVVTVVFYFILKYFQTANVEISTLSVTTSFLAAYMTYKRSPYYAIGYAANDLVLIAMWILMLPYTSAAFSMVLCFAAFFVNDIYGFINWNRLYVRQKPVLEAETA